MSERRTISNRTKIMRNNDIFSSEIDEETVMMSIENGEYYGINSVGSYIWKLLETPRSFGSLKTELRKEFDVSEEECNRDLGEFVAALQKKNLLLMEEQ